MVKNMNSRGISPYISTLLLLIITLAVGVSMYHIASSNISYSIDKIVDRLSNSKVERLTVVHAYADTNAFHVLLYNPSGNVVDIVGVLVNNTVFIDSKASIGPNEALWLNATYSVAGNNYYILKVVSKYGGVWAVDVKT